MPQKALSSLDLAALVNELQFLVKGKLPQIYHQNQEFLLQFHVPGKGKQFLRVLPGKFLCLTKNKETALKQSGFCLLLRKYLDNALVRALEQKDSERIVVLDLEKEQKYHLIFELFSRGNVILTDENYQIIGAEEYHIWKDRAVKAKEKYVFPSSGINWKTMNEKELKKILPNSTKKNLATSLATDIGLGGIYAEEICRRAEIDKNKLPQEIEEKEVSLILEKVKEILREIKEPKGFFYAEAVTPFALTGKEELRKTPSYSEAVDSLNFFQKESPYEQKINSLRHMVAEQEESIKNLEKSQELNKRKGELIYEHYEPLRKLLGFVKEARESKSWNEIVVELKKVKKIKSINLKDKKILLDL